jgi:MFS transporter, ACDE family, multidrug resistance protein
MRRGVALLLYVTLFVAETSWSAVAPLLPSFADRFGLDGSRTGLILSVASLAILAISIPAGGLVHRLGARRVTISAGVAMTTGNLAIGVASGYGALLVGRAMFGLGLGMLWVAGTSWLHSVTGDRAARALSMTSAIIGLGSLVGPGFAGVVGEHLGTGAPFLVFAGVTALVTVALAVAPARGREARADDDGPRFADLIRAATRDDPVRASVVLMLLGALLWLSSYVLVPLRLDAEGWSAAGIGLAFSISSLVYAGVSWFVARRAERVATLRVGAVATAALAASLIVVTVSASPAALVAFLMLAGAASAVMIAITYPLGVSGGVSVALVGGLLNVAWATAGLIGPQASGAGLDLIGERGMFGVLAAVTAAGAVWMARAGRHRTGRPAAMAVGDVVMPRSDPGGGEGI